MNTIINREAGDKLKGPRLQRLRCLSLMFDALSTSDRPFIYSAVEVKDDVIIKDATKGEDLLEQNKNFAEGAAFSFSNTQVLNTIVGFCDMWAEYAVSSKNVLFSFYTTSTIAREINSPRIKALGITLPDKSIIELLIARTYDHPNFLPAVKALILAEYKDQYAGKKAEGYLDLLEKYSDDDWKKLLDCIKWSFGELDEEKTQLEVIEKVKKCKFYSSLCSDKEKLILNALMDLLDEKQCLTDLLAKFLNAAEVELIFRNVAENTFLQDDPVHKIWDSLPPPTDKRTILDKVKHVCSGINPKSLQRIARNASAGRILHDDKSSDKTFLSLRYRIYERCEKDLEEYLKEKDKDVWASEEEINDLFKYINEQCKKHVEEMAKEFKYSMKGDTVVEGIILELFDSCYLSMDVA